MTATTSQSNDVLEWLERAGLPTHLQHTLARCGLSTLSDIIAAENSALDKFSQLIQANARHLFLEAVAKLKLIGDQRPGHRGLIPVVSDGVAWRCQCGTSNHVANISCASCSLPPPMPVTQDDDAEPEPNAPVAPAPAPALAPEFPLNAYPANPPRFPWKPLLLSISIHMAVCTVQWCQAHCADERESRRFLVDLIESEWTLTTLYRALKLGFEV